MVYGQDGPFSAARCHSTLPGVLQIETPTARHIGPCKNVNRQKVVRDKLDNLFHKYSYSQQERKQRTQAHQN